MPTSAGAVVELATVRFLWQASLLLLLLLLLLQMLSALAVVNGGAAVHIAASGGLSWSLQISALLLLSVLSLLLALLLRRSRLLLPKCHFGVAVAVSTFGCYCHKRHCSFDANVGTADAAGADAAVDVATV